MSQSTYMIRPSSERIGALLTSPQQFCIPRYQREFKWGLDEATELIEDIENVVGDPENTLFLGTMIFETSQAGKLAIVDGQQRITSLLLLLIACRERAKALGEGPRVAAIQNKIGFVDEATGKSVGSRLIAAQSIRELFAHMASSDWDEVFPQKIGVKPIKRQVNRLRPLYGYFKTKVIDLLDSKKLTEFLNAIYNSYVFRIEIVDDVQALGLFERTNARGVELEVADLLKNYLFAKNVDRDLIEDSWAQITSNSAGQMLRMLKHFYTAKKGAVTKPVLYKKLKGYGNDVGAQQLTSQLLDFSQFHQLVRCGDADAVLTFFANRGLDEITKHADRYKRIHCALEGLREFGIVQFIPVAYAAIECLVRNKCTQDKASIKLLVRLFDSFEKYHFINNAICERVSNDNEKLYAKAAEEYALANEFIGSTNKIINELKKRNASEDEFALNFPKKVNYQEGITLVAYVFDRINNVHNQPGAGVKIYDPDPRVFRKTHNIEHFLAQNPKSGPLYAKEAELVDDVGNLLIVPSEVNGKLGNFAPFEKMALLTGSLNSKIKHLNHVEAFIAKYKAMASSWDAEAIGLRSRDLAKLAYREVWKL